MYTYRLHERVAQRALDEHKVLVLVGARQTGKSTLTRELLRRLPDSQKLILSLDDPFLRDRLVEGETTLERLVEDRTGKPWANIDGFHLVLDEAQKAPELFEIVKALYDANRRKVRFVLTGSSALAIHDPVAESLAGRARIHHLHPFTLSEGFAHTRGEDPTQGPLAESMSKLLCGRFEARDFQALQERARWSEGERRAFASDRLRYPLFPEPSPSDEPELWLRDYLATYLEKDIESLSTVGSVSLFRNTLRQLAARVGSTMKWETAAQEIGTTSVTLRKYAGLMEQTFNVLRLQPFVVNPVKRVIKAPKLYFFDNGLLWALRGYEDLRLLEASGMLGIYAEQLAIAEVAKWCTLEPTSPQLRFWARGVHEVDLVVSNRGYHIPFEIKLGKRFEKRWLKGLDAFDADHESLRLAIPYRLILYFGEGQQIDERTYAIPLAWLA